MDVEVMEDYMDYNTAWLGSSFSRKWLECSQTDGYLRVWANPDRHPRDLMFKIPLWKADVLPPEESATKDFMDVDLTVEAQGVLGMKKKYYFRAATYEHRCPWERFLLATRQKHLERNAQQARRRHRRQRSIVGIQTSTRITVNFDLRGEFKQRFTFSKVPTVMDIVNLVRNSPHLDSDGSQLSLVCNGKALKNTDKVQ